MMIAMRIECPHCKWGYPWRDSFINQGWLAHRCPKCNKKFFNKVTVMGFSVETHRELPEGMPCQTLPEAKEPRQEDFCDCSFPSADSVSAKNNTCAECSKVVRGYD